MICRLCSTETSQLFYSNSKEGNYFLCGFCGVIFLDPEFFVSEAKEKQIYLQHNNDVNDKGYRAFLKPLVDEIINRKVSTSTGLDFGCGTGPVASEMLKEHGYQTKLYDPFFADFREHLQPNTYDFIICSEVAEHFHNPKQDFEILASLLKSDGILALMTLYYHEGIDFSDWYYRRDPTHVIFYQRKSIEQICKLFGLKLVYTDDVRLSILQKS